MCVCVCVCVREGDEVVRIRCERSRLEEKEDEEVREGKRDREKRGWRRRVQMITMNEE